MGLEAHQEAHDRPASTSLHQPGTMELSNVSMFLVSIAKLNVKVLEANFAVTDSAVGLMIKK